MLKLPVFALSIMATAVVNAQEVPQAGYFPLRPAHTYSIVARDPDNGQLGVAVQSHWFSVGGGVAWAEPGIGAVATQSFTEVSYGPLGLELMRGGKSAEQSLKALLAADDHINVRQVAMVDGNGNTAVHTGENAIIAHCDHAGKGFTVQANLMLNDTVCDAMTDAFTTTTGDLAERMMAALEAAQSQGGDVRGKQSAALLVVSGDKTLPHWAGRIFDLRVEDNDDPVVELRRLLTLNRAYHLMDEGDGHMTSGDMAAALKSYSAAEELAPDNHEMIFWHAATLAAAGDVDSALPYFAKAYALWPQWRILVPRLPASGLLPNDPEMIKHIMEAK